MARLANGQQNSSYGAYQLAPLPRIVGGVGFDPSSVSSWDEMLSSAEPGVDITGDVGTFRFNSSSGGPATFIINVRPFASQINSAAGTLYVYTHDAAGRPTVQAFPVGGGGLEPTSYTITYGDTSNGPYVAAVYFTIVPAESGGGAALQRGVQLLKMLGIINGKLPGVGATLPAAGYFIQMLRPGFSGPRSRTIMLIFRSMRNISRPPTQHWSVAT